MGAAPGALAGAAEALGPQMGMMAVEEGIKGMANASAEGEDSDKRKQNMQMLRANSAFNEGGLATLKGGGSIKMVDGQYVVSADVVSALGNGSSKAGAKFLQEAFNQIRAQGNRRPAKPQKRAGALAEKRMLERVKKRKAA